MEEQFEAAAAEAPGARTGSAELSADDRHQGNSAQGLEIGSGASPSWDTGLATAGEPAELVLVLEL